MVKVETRKVERIIVDDQGVRIRENKLRQWRRDRIRSFNIHSQNNPLKSPTSKDLEKLEDAIFNHGEEYRTPFLEITNPTKHLIPIGFKDYLSEFPSNRRRALLYCWQIKKWRPDSTGNRVINGSLNPYIK